MKPIERNDFKHRLLLLAVLLFFGLAVSAQTLKVSGTVTDPKGEPLIGVTVKAVNAVPRLAGVILKGESGQTYSIKIYDENGSHSELFSETSANFIKGVKEDTTMVTVEKGKAKYGLKCVYIPTA